MKTLLIMLVLSCITTKPTKAAMGPLDKPKKKDKSRTITINGVIRAPGILSKANELYKLSSESKDNINLVINSPGGAVFAGLQIINAMEAAQARGIRIKCYVPGMAASLAFQILLHCDERYAFKYSLLLFHPVRISGMGNITPQKAAFLTKSLETIEAVLLTKLRRELKMKDKEFMFHYLEETMHTAIGLNELSPGFIEMVKDMSVISTKVWNVDRMRRQSQTGAVTWEEFELDSCRINPHPKKGLEL